MPVSIQTRNLTEVILDSGIQNTNYFNGRILNAGDLRTDQDANRQQHEQLGLGLGTGIVRGLQVSLLADGTDGNPPVLSVSAGLAFNPKGQAVALAGDVAVALRRASSPQPVSAGLFADCLPPSADTPPVDAAFYVLLASPASGFTGRAPARGFADTIAANGCGSAHAVEGVSFRLAMLDIAKLSALSQTTRDGIAALMTRSDAPSLSRLRNWTAHVCFGSEELTGFPIDPFRASGAVSAFAKYGALDAITSTGAITNADVPLALLFWARAGVGFVDGWSVRRMLVPEAPSAAWPLLGARRIAEGVAMFAQFQAQVASILRQDARQTDLLAVTASDWFRYLPALGILPLTGTNALGFSATGFFTGRITRGPVFTRDALLEPLLRLSTQYPAIDLAGTELIWLYLSPGNAARLNTPAGAASYLIFAHPHIPYQGDSRFDTSQWNLSNFALTAGAIAAP
jgi:hypothetical protein